jgi:hypothetical protein
MQHKKSPCNLKKIFDFTAFNNSSVIYEYLATIIIINCIFSLRPCLHPPKYYFFLSKQGHRHLVSHHSETIFFFQNKATVTWSVITLEKETWSVIAQRKKH